MAAQSWSNFLGFSIMAEPLRIAAHARVVMTRDDLDRFSHRVQAEFTAVYPDRILAQSNPPPSGGVDVKLMFAEYDKGNALTWLMPAGLGQIRNDTNVFLIEPASDRTVGEFEVSKDFALGASMAVRQLSKTSRTRSHAASPQSSKPPKEMQTAPRRP